MAQGQEASPEAYAQGGLARLAVLLTRADSHWLALAHSLKTFGIPFVMTSDWHEAAKHRVILAYPGINEGELPDEARAGLKAAIEAGATLVAVRPSAASWKDIFGYESAASASHEQWRFAPGIKELVPLSDPKDLTIPLTWISGRNLDTCAFIKPADAPLAVFEDGSAAMLQHALGKGTAYAVGADFGQMLQISQTLRDEKIERSYADSYEPAADVWLRLLREIYVKGEPAAVTLGTVPMGKEMTVLITHDIDYLDSVKNSLAFAAFESSAGIKATYFLQTKYVSDAAEHAFMTPESLGVFRGLVSTGHEIASHSVAHAHDFSKFPEGSGKEKYPGYQPHGQNDKTTVGGTIMGELRVSKFLIESLLGTGLIYTFRPGYLADPWTLPEDLAAVGYRFSSSCTANNSLTHLPYRLTKSRESRVETAIFEFPVTFSDGGQAPLAGRLPQALALAEVVAKFGGLFTILIHPSVIEGKLDFEKAFVAVWKDRAWFGSMSGLGRWWAARDAVEVDADATAKTVTLSAPQPIDGLLLRVPSGWILDGVDPAAVSAESAAGGLLLRHLSGKSVLHFH